MRASTLFGITLALLLGLAVVVGAKMGGFFDKKGDAPPTQAQYQVLVPRGNLFKDVTCSGNMVMVRNASSEEAQLIKNNPLKYAPPNPMWADLRILKSNASANEPLLREHFQDLGIPPTLSDRIKYGYRAVNIVLPKDRAGGGLLSLNDQVDVLLTTAIGSNGGHTRTATAPIARNLRVLIKRDNLWAIMQPDRDQVSFILEANPYRAALIEFAKYKGILTLVPSPNPLPSKEGVMFIDKKALPPMDPELKDEDTRLQAFLAGEITVGDTDLERIFRLRSPTRVAAAPLTPPVIIDRLRGVNKVQPFVFDAPAPVVASAATGPQSFNAPGGIQFGDTPSAGFSFSAPGGAAYGPPQGARAVAEAANSTAVVHRLR